MNVIPVFFKRCLLFLGLCLVAGCAVPYVKPAIFMDTGFQPAALDKIVVLPALDNRIDKTIDVNIEKQIREVGVKSLERKDYQVTVSDDLGDGITQILEDDLRAADIEWVKRLGPAKSRWVMVLMLVDVTTKLTFGSTGNAEVGGFLYDKQAGALVWRDKGIGKAGQGGLIGMCMKDMMDEEAISNAMNNLLASIPEKPKSE